MLGPYRTLMVLLCVLVLITKSATAQAQNNQIEILQQRGQNLGAKPEDAAPNLKQLKETPPVVPAAAANSQTSRGPQSGFPKELILGPPSPESIANQNRFIQGTVDPKLPLKLVIGRPKILQLKAAPKRIYVPSDDVIKTEIIDEVSGKEVAVTGLTAGTTTLILWFEDPMSPTGESIVSYLVQVFEDPVLARPIEDLERELNLKFPNSFVELDQIEDRMIVRGQTPTVVEMGQILQVLTGTRGIRTEVSRPENPIRLTTALNFEADIDPLQSEENAAARRRQIDPVALARAGIINQLKVAGEQQVMLKVTVAEVNRTAARSIGLNFAVDSSSGGTVFQSLAGNLIQGGAGGAGGGAGANALVSLDTGQVRLAIQALRNLSLSRTLAEPNLVALNGETAEFQAGGSFPVPIISAGGNGGGQNLQGVSFIPFGVQLGFTPIIQDGNVIRLQVNAEVSTRDETAGTSIGGGGGGTQVAGLSSRNFSTTIQLRSGQTIAVAGLMQTNFGASTDRVPFWGDLPFLGHTGGVSRTSSGEQELVILITPHLVSPISEFQKPALPGSDVFEPTDLEFYLANRLESRRGMDFRTSVQTDYARLKSANRYPYQNLMIGNVGPTDRVIITQVVPASTSSTRATGTPSTSSRVARKSSNRNGG